MKLLKVAHTNRATRKTSTNRRAENEHSTHVGSLVVQPELREPWGYRFLHRRNDYCVCVDSHWNLGGEEWLKIKTKSRFHSNPFGRLVVNTVGLTARYRLEPSEYYCICVDILIGILEGRNG